MKIYLDAMRQFTIYAELLANLGQVSIAISLPSLCDESTRIQLPHGDSISIHHQGREKTLRLPATVAQKATLKIPSSPVKELSFRLPLSERVSRHLFRENLGNPVPWTAESLNLDLIIFCRSCKSTLVPDKTVTVWKALPSQNWAEMMEFWHCHKPSEKHQDQEKLATTGNNSSNAPYLRSGIGLVDTCSLIVSEQDCFSLKVFHSFPFHLERIILHI